MKQALEAANEMRNLGLIGEYAIVGSVAIIYYAAPINTDDLDIFFLHGTGPDEIFSMHRIYAHLKSAGFEPEDFTVNIGGVKVQFVPSTGPLSDEAISSARDATLFGVATRVASPEYLIAMKLKAGRTKDFLHIAHLLENSTTTIDFAILRSIISRFELDDVWNRFVSSGQ